MTIPITCNHCGRDYWAEDILETIVVDKDGYWSARCTICTGCEKAQISIVKKVRSGAGLDTEFIVYPLTRFRKACPDEVPKTIAIDYKEALDVIEKSPKAAAALCRRCLQNLLREYGKVKRGKLYNEIDEFLKRGQINPTLRKKLSAIRHYGNFAAHPERDVRSGEIVEVEEGEAEWCISILEDLFDYFFIAPKSFEDKMAQLNTKLEKAGKKANQVSDEVQSKEISSKKDK